MQTVFVERHRTAEEQRRQIEQDPAVTTVAAAIRAACADASTRDDDLAVLLLDSQGNERRLGYGELWSAMLGVAAGLRVQGMREGDRILLLLPTSEDYLISLCAAIILGLVPCTVPAPASRSKSDDALSYLAAICQKLEPSALIAPEYLVAMLGEHPDVGKWRILHPDELRHAGHLDPAELPVLKPEQPHHIQLTSGSTNRPKGVVLTHRNVVANIQAIGKRIEFSPEDDRFLIWLPLYHDMGLVQLLIVLYYRSTIALMPPMSFLRNPLSWLRSISTHRATLSAAPTFAYRLCVQKFDPAKLQGLDLSSWRGAFIGAEPVPLEIVTDFTERYRAYGFPETTMCPCYGMAETVLATTLPPASGTRLNTVFGRIVCDYIDPDVLRRDGRAVASGDTPRRQDAMPVLGMGYAVPGLDVVIEGPDGARLADRVVGEICVRGSSVMGQYFHDRPATEAAVKAGWYHTGDRGYMVADELFVVGRIKEMLIVWGRNYQPHDIEAVIEQSSGVRKGYSVAFGIFNSARGTEDVIALVETRVAAPEQPILLQEIQQALQRVFGFRAHTVIFVPHGTLPRTTSGKKQRLLAQAWYQNGRFSAEGDSHDTGSTSADSNGK